MLDGNRPPAPLSRTVSWPRTPASHCAAEVARCGDGCWLPASHLNHVVSLPDEKGSVRSS